MARVVFFKKLALLLGDILFFTSIIILLNWIRAEDSGFIREAPIQSVFFLLFFVVCMYITDLYNLEETYTPWNYLTRIVVSALAGTLFFFFLHSNHIPFSFLGAQFILFLLTIMAWRRLFHYI